MFYFTLLFFSLPREKRKWKKRKEKAKIKIKFKSLIYLSLSRLLSSLTNTPSNHNNSLLFGISPFFFSINTNEYIPLPSRYLPYVGTLLSNKQQIKKLIITS